MTGQREEHSAEEIIRSGSKSFALASKLFDARTRHLVWDLYAWCRHCDDVIDGQALGHGRSAVGDREGALELLRRETDRAMDGARDGSAPFVGLSHVAAATGLPRRFVHAHLDGFAMDVDGRHYASLDDTLEYCYGVAGVVGLMMAWIMGVRDESTLLRGCDLGLGFQLTNIARDVGDDLEAGRLYLPSQWLDEAGVVLRPGTVLVPEARAAVARVVARLLDEADRYYASAWHGVPHLQWRSAWAVATARHVYADIGREVRRRGDRAWETRVVVTKRRKVWRLAHALIEAACGTALRGRRPAPREGLWTPPTPVVAHVRLGS